MFGAKLLPMRSLRLTRSISTNLNSQHDWGTVIDGFLPQTKDFVTNKANMDDLTSLLHAKLSKAFEGGGPKQNARHKSRGKLLVRERINSCVDVGTPFLELSALAGHGK